MRTGLTSIFSLDSKGKYHTQTELSQPEDVALSPDGNTVAVADTGNNRVRLYTINGQRLSVIGMKGKGQSQFDLPLSVTIHPMNVLLVGDSENNRVQVSTMV